MLFFGSFTRSIVWLNLKLAVSAVYGIVAGEGKRKIVTSSTPLASSMPTSIERMYHASNETCIPSWTWRCGTREQKRRPTHVTSHTFSRSLPPRAPTFQPRIRAASARTYTPVLYTTAQLCLRAGSSRLRRSRRRRTFWTSSSPRRNARRRRCARASHSQCTESNAEGRV
jgi:hypothetical protein